MTAPRARDDRGSESVELAILGPGLVIVILFVFALGRVGLVSDRMSGVASIAARDASLTRSPDAARAAANSSARSALAAADLHCASVSVTVDTSDFANAPGTPSFIHVWVTCRVDLSDVVFHGLPGSQTLHDDALSPLDPARDTS